jgi:hypothetical protein
MRPVLERQPKTGHYPPADRLTGIERNCPDGSRKVTETLLLYSCFDCDVFGGVVTIRFSRRLEVFSDPADGGIGGGSQLDNVKVESRPPFLPPFAPVDARQIEISAAQMGG